jgi:hypothetical protein
MSNQTEPRVFGACDRVPASLTTQQLCDIDAKVIAFFRALSSGDTSSAANIEEVAKTREPVEAFGEEGAQYLRKAISDARACFELVRRPQTANV